MLLFAVWSFASPWLLLWGATAALPVLIHLWSRRRYFETPWAATQFLLAAIRRHHRRIQIEQWLLLAIRAAILLLLAVALAQPILSGLVGVSGRMRQPPTYTIIVVDTSYSMAFESSGSSRLAQAQTLAAKLVEDAAPGDAFSLVTLAEPPEVIIRDPSASHAAVLDEINRLRITNRGADLAATLEQVERLVDAAEKRFEVQLVYILSDLGKATWSDSPTDDWSSRLTAMSQRVTTQLSHIGQGENSDNTAVTRIAITSSSVNVGVPVSVEVDIESFARRPQLRKQVKLSVDGQLVGEQFVDMEIGGQATALFSVTFNVAGDHAVSASIGGDGLKADDERWLAVPVRDATRVLCVQGRPHAAEYVALALQPSDDTAGDVDRLSTEVASEHAILERDLQEYNCIFLCNVARFTPVEARQLRQYVEWGGGLVFALGDLVRADLYNEQFGGNSPTKLLPARLNEIVGDGRHTFDPLEYRHSLTLPFRGHERAGLLTVPIWRYIRIDRVIDTASVALAFDNGDPAIVEAQVGEGRVLLLTTAASPESLDRATDPPTPWTALASWPSFPPLIHEIVQFVASDRAAQRNVLVGDLLSLQLPASLTSVTGTLSAPDNNQIPLRLDGNERVWTYGRTGQPGVYRLALDDQAIAQAIFAVNLKTATSNASESDLEPVPFEGVAGYFDTEIQAGTQTDIASPTVVQREVPLFRLALGGLLALLLVETFLACRFGRASR